MLITSTPENREAHLKKLETSVPSRLNPASWRREVDDVVVYKKDVPLRDGKHYAINLYCGVITGLDKKLPAREESHASTTYDVELFWRIIQTPKGWTTMTQFKYASLGRKSQKPTTNLINEYEAYTPESIVLQYTKIPLSTHLNNADTGEAIGLPQELKRKIRTTGLSTKPEVSAANEQFKSLWNKQPGKRSQKITAIAKKLNISKFDVVEKAKAVGIPLPPRLAELYL